MWGMGAAEIEMASEMQDASITFLYCQIKNQQGNS